MNKIFKVIWSRALNQYVVVSEFSKAYVRSGSSRPQNTAYLFKYSFLTLSLYTAFSMPTQAAIQIGSTGTNSGNVTVSGAGAKAGTENPSNIAIGSGANATSVSGDGNGALAVGGNTTATGNQAVALGSNTFATSAQATAIGNDVHADGYGSVAIGGDDMDGVPQASQTLYKQYVGSDLINKTNTITQYPYTHAKGAASTAVGVSAQALGDLSTALGAKSQAAGAMALALGTAAKATGNTSVALGTNAYSNSVGSMALGLSSQALGANAFAGGSYAYAGQDNATAVGYKANANASNAVAVGNSSKASALNTVALGNNAQALTQGTIVFGFNAGANSVARTDDGLVANIAIGYQAGMGAGSNAQSNIALGRAAGSNTLGQNNIAIGTGSQAGTNTAGGTTSVNDGNIAIGDQAKAYGNFAIAMGGATQATGAQAVAIGAGSNAFKTSGLALGAYSVASNSHTIALGQDASAYGEGSFAAMQSALTIGKNAVALGKESQATANDALALGTGAKVISTGATVEFTDGVKGNTAAQKKETKSTRGTTNSANSIAFGNTATVTDAQNAIAFGTSATIGSGAANAIAFGNTAKATASNAVAIGANAQAGTSNSVALGNNSVTAVAVSTSSAEVNGISYSGFAGTSPIATVSVGAAGSERTITNVAAGRVTATSTDAINGSQLYLVANALGNVANSTKSILGGNATLASNGTISTSDIGGTGKSTIHEAVQVAKTEVQAGTNTSVSSSLGTNGQTIYTVNAEGATVSAGSSGLVEVSSTLDNITNVTTYTLDLSKNAKEAISQVATNTSNIETLQTDVAKNKTDIAQNATNIANNTTSIASNKSAIDSLQKGWNLTTTGNTANATSEAITAEKTVTIDGGKNIQLTQDGSKITVATADDVSFKSVTSNTITSNTITGDTITIGNKVTINSNGINAGNTTISNVADAKADGDAVNKKQMEAAISNAGKWTLTGNGDTANAHTITAESTVNFADGTGTTASVSTDNGVSKVSYSINTTTFNNTNGTISAVENGDKFATAGNVANAINNATQALTDKGLTFVGDDNTQVARKLGETLTIKGGVTDTNKLSDNNIGVVGDSAGSLTIKLAKDLSDLNEVSANTFTAGNTTINNDGLKITNGPSITTAGINANNTIISNVADAQNTNDAVNKGQLDAVAKSAKSEVQAGTNIASITTGQGADGQTIYTVNAEGAKVAVGSDSLTLSKNTDANNVTTYTVDLSDNAQKAINQVATNTSNIQTLQSSVVQNTSDIANNATNIANNTTNIATNTANITKNSDAITQLQKGWTLASSADTTGTTINAGDKVTINAGQNIALTQNSNSISIATADNVSFESVASNTISATTSITAGDTVINTSGVTIGSGTNAVSLTNAGLNNGGNKITNIADGSATGDAVNYGQLSNAIANINTSISNAGKWTLQNNGTADQIITAANKVNFADGTGTTAKASTSGDTTTVSYDVNTTTFNNTNGTISADQNGNTFATAENVANAINDATQALTNKGLTFVGDDATKVKRKLGETLTIKGGETDSTKLSDNNIGVVGDSSTGALTIKLSKTLSDLESVSADTFTAGNTTINNDGLTIAGGASITSSGINAGGSTISNVADAQNTNDAINKGQLDNAITAINTSISNAGKWNLTVNSGSNQEITSASTVNFANGQGTTVNSTTTGATTNISFDINKTTLSTTNGTVTATDKGDNFVTADEIAQAINSAVASGKTEVKSSDSSLSVEETTGVTGQKVYDLKVARATVTTADGKASTSNGENGFVTGDTLVNTVNNISTALTDKGLTFVGDDATKVKRKLGDTLNIKGGVTDASKLSDNNIGVVGDSSTGALTIKLSKTLSDLESVSANTFTAGNTTINNSGVTVVNASGGKTYISDNGIQITNALGANTVSLTSDGLNNGGNVLSNIAAGQDDLDAVNVSQLNQLKNDIQSNAYKGWNVSTQGQNATAVASGATVDFSNNDNNLSISNNGTNITIDLAKDLSVDSVTAGNTVINTNGISIGTGANAVSLTADGLNNGGQKITGVAAGDISAGSTEAINGGQLYDLKNELQTNVNNITNNYNNLVGTDNLDGKIEIRNGDGTTKQITAQEALITYDVVGSDSTHEHNSVLSAIYNMNTKGIKFFHVNDGTNTAQGSGKTTDDSNAEGLYSTAIGFGAEAKGESAVVLGANSKANGAQSVAIGNNSYALGTQSIAIGTENIVSGNHSGAIGDPNIVSGNESYAVGNNNTISTDNTFVVGNNVTITAENSVALGANTAITTGTSVNTYAVKTDGTQGTTTTAGTTGTVSSATVGGITYGDFAGASASGAVSVGASGTERRIQNVAAGEISETSTDAINGSQLYAVAQGSSNTANSITQILGGNATLEQNGSITISDIGGTGQNNINDAIAVINQNNAAQVNYLNNRINQVDERARSGIASAMATAGLPQAYLPGKSMVAAAAGNYRGETAIAIGASAISDNGKWIIKGTANANRKDTGVTVGIGYQW